MGVDSASVLVMTLSPEGERVSVCLVIFQNHQYTRNIEVLDRLYGERFDHIVHVVPFYDGSRDDVIPVY